MSRPMTAASAAVFLLASLACGGADATTATNQQPIVNGSPDTAHPFVGTIATLQGGVFKNNCSGVMVAPRVFVTAGHCIFKRIVTPDLGPGDFGAKFGAGPGQMSALVPGTAAHLHPAFPDVDVGVIVLSDAPDLGTATLPARRVLDDLQRAGGLVGRRFTVVGYGATEGAPRVASKVGTGVRRVGTVEFDSLIGQALHERVAPAEDLSAICNQDSGGPNFLEDDPNLVVAVNSRVGSLNCNGTAFAQRLDTPEAVEFLAQFLEE